MTIERIFTRPTPGGQQAELRTVRIVAGSGIEGDRHFGRHDDAGQNISFIEAEVIEAFFDEQGLPRELSVTGRNIVVRGVRMNALVGNEFTVGSLRFRGRELCEPCLGLGERLATPTLTPPQVVKWFVARGGLRADALTSGELALGATFETSLKV
ncbi:MAG: sulfurase [Rhodoferax sp.]|nr:sulfurase [Rhodoferax sp.]